MQLAKTSQRILCLKRGTPSLLQRQNLTEDGDGASVQVAQSLYSNHTFPTLIDRFTSLHKYAFRL